MPQVNRKSKYYVGFRADKVERTVFKATETPTRAAFPQYGAVVGPFRTKRAAILCAVTHPNPHIQHVRDAERIAKENA